MADPVSWFLIEPGWKVVDADGRDVGAIDEIVGDPSDDIFNGLGIATGLLSRPRYVEAEQVAEITEGQVRLKLSKAAVEQLPEYKEAPTSAQILPQGAGLVERAEASVEAPIRSKPERMSVIRRAWFALRRSFGR